MKRSAAPRTAVVVAALIALAACGDPGSATGESPAPRDATAPSGAASAAVCDPVPGDELVVLKDDQGLQTVDNIIPAVNAATAEANPALLPLLDAVSTALDTDALIALNRAVDVDRRTSAEVAAEWVESSGITADDPQAGAGTRIAVGAADFSESATLGAIYAAVLGKAGFDVEVVTVGNREAYLPALRTGTQIHVVPEYVGTLTEFLNRSLNGADAEPIASSDLDATVKGLTQLGTEAGLVFGEPSEAANQNAFAVTKGFAEEHGLASLSDLAAACTGLVLGAGPECTERPFCQPGLEQSYGLVFADFRPLDAGGPLTKTALQQGEITLGLVFSSDGALSANPNE